MSSNLFWENLNNSDTSCPTSLSLVVSLPSCLHHGETLPQLWNIKDRRSQLRIYWLVLMLKRRHGQRMLHQKPQNSLVLMWCSMLARPSKRLFRLLSSRRRRWTWMKLCASFVVRTDTSPRSARTVKARRISRGRNLPTWLLLSELIYTSLNSFYFQHHLRHRPLALLCLPSEAPSWPPARASDAPPIISYNISVDEELSHNKMSLTQLVMCVNFFVLHL